jgi:tetratricopeptide (TPR) repeat protein
MRKIPAYRRKKVGKHCYAVVTIKGKDLYLGDYTEAIRLNAKDPHAYHNRGLAYQEKGDSDKAKADLEMAKKLGLKVNNP